TEDESMAYGARAARLLGAAHSAIAWSGRGLVRNYGGDTKDLMPSLWERTLATDPASRWSFGAPPPDVVVVNLGSNDFSVGDPGTPFRDALVAFVGRIRAKYPAALVLCTLGPMLDGDKVTQARAHVAGAVAILRANGDAHVSFLEFPTQ